MKNFLIKTTKIIFVIIGYFFSIESHAQYIDSRKYRDNKPFIIAEGFINFSSATHRQTNAYESKILSDGISRNRLSSSNYSIGNDSQIFLKSAIKNNQNQKFGAIAKLEFNFSSDRIKENPNLDQVFLFAENDFGKFEIGNNQAVNQKMKYGPARFARGSGGINGKYLQYVNLPMLSSSNNANPGFCDPSVSLSCTNLKLPRFITLAQSPIGHGGYAKSFYRQGIANDYNLNNHNYSAYSRRNFRAFKDDSYDGIEDSTKISYYSPKINGLQLGLSYSPDSTKNGFTANTATDINYFHLKNIFAFGANYVEDFDNLTLAISATAEKAQIKNSKSNNLVQRQDLLAYDLGFALSYFGFKLGASYGNWGKSMQAKSGIYSCQYQSNVNISYQDCTNNIKKFINPYYYTFGIAYQFAGLSTSISTLNSNFQNNRFRALSLGLDYKYSKNLLPYFEYTKFAFLVDQPQGLNLLNQASLDNNSRQLKNNQGHIFLIGILYSF